MITGLGRSQPLGVPVARTMARLPGHHAWQPGFWLPNDERRNETTGPVPFVMHVRSRLGKLALM